MFYINQNKTLNELETLIQEKVQYMPKGFIEQQEKALELFQKRVFLEEVIDESITFNQKLSWECEDTNLQLTTTAEELVNVFKIRSEIYTEINYQEEFPDTIEGLNFDIFDKHAAIVYYQSNDEIIGTTRVIFDEIGKLPSEGKFSFNDMRQKHAKIAEVSRLVVRHKDSGLNLGFKNLMKGLYLVFNQNELDITLSGIKKEHFKFYSKLGGVNIEKEMEGYGTLTVPFVIMSWDLSQTSRFFQRSFLK